jgi:hypothetical protein
MIIKGGSRSNRRFFAQHLLNGKDNERVRVVEVRGFNNANVRSAFCDMEAVAKGNRHEEERMLDALHNDLFPTEAARAAYDRETVPLQPPDDKDDRRQWQDLREMDGSVQPETAKESSDMTPKQQENVDKALARADLTDMIGGATDVSGRPAPNDPTPIEKAKDIGQDLHKQGVTMDK